MNKVLTENLYRALKQVKRTTVHSLPVLNHVHLEFREGELHLATTDLDKWLVAKCASRVNEEWETCVPLIVICKEETYDRKNKRWNKHTYKYYPFIDYVKVMCEQVDVLELDFIPETQTLVITAGRSRAEFKCLDAMEFPPVREQAVA